MSQTPAAIRKPECLSMTGYAQARAETPDLALRVSIKSVNHRFLDLKMRLAEGLELYESRLRQVVRERIHRGHVEIAGGGGAANRSDDSGEPGISEGLHARR